MEPHTVSITKYLPDTIVMDEERKEAAENGSEDSAAALERLNAE